MTTPLALDIQIAEAAAAFRSAHYEASAALLRSACDEYRTECVTAATRLLADVPLMGAASGRAALLDYATWLSWVFWNAANLAPLSAAPLLASRRLAAAGLAYAGGRLVDDGLDAHVEFKGRRVTFLGALTPDGAEPSPPACAASVLTGFLLFSHAMTRLRHWGDEALARRLERLLLASGGGALAEAGFRHAPSRAAYWSIVRRKQIDYNMLLYVPLLQDTPAADRRDVLRALAGIEALAQLLNDLSDRVEDAHRGHLNAFADGVLSARDASSLVAARRQRIWSRVARSSERVRGVVAVMLDHLEPPPAEPRPVRAPGLAVRFDQATAAAQRYLAAAQMAHGEFPTYWSRTKSLEVAPEYAASPFVTALVLFCLHDVDACAADLRDRALRRLAAWRGRDGLVRFLADGIDPDLDDTALVNYLLLAHRFDRWPYRALAVRLAAIERLDGLYPTWLRPAAGAPNDVDPCVTTNVLRFLHSVVVPADDAWHAVRRAALAAPRGEGTLYYESPAALPFFVATLPVGARRRLLSDDELRRVAKELADRFTSRTSRSPVDVAMALSVAARAGVDVASRDELCRALIAWQRSSGEWPAWAAFRAFNYWGSPALTTALAVHALLSHRAAGV
jgi:hypothetical protein